MPVPDQVRDDGCANMHGFTNCNPVFCARMTGAQRENSPDLNKLLYETSPLLEVLVSMAQPIAARRHSHKKQTFISRDPQMKI
jgi:hypothetical protein